MEGSNPSPNHLLVTSMREELERLPPLSPDCCIYRVPERLRCVNEQAYTPKVVSIGPLHHGKESLRAMEKHKMRYLRSFLLRNLPAKLEDYVEKVKCQEARLRSCYEEEDIELSSDEFVRVILVDAAFVIELLLRFSGDQLENEKDRIFYKPWMIADIARDMLLLENQLPFFILQDLYDLGNIGSHSPLFSLISLSCSFLNMTVVLEGTEDNPERVPPSSSKVEHFLGLLRTLHLPLLTKAQVGGRLKTLTVPCMTELRLAGVKFKAGSSKNLFEMRFINGILEIPKMTIHDHTELVARNLVAFEQCHCVEYYLTDYFVLLDSFVDTPNDVELLARNGILENLLGDNNDVSTLINNLGNGVGYDCKNFYYATVCEDINKYCKTARHKWEASLRQKYFNTPWRAISVIAAVFLLTLATIQAVCSIISVR